MKLRLLISILVFCLIQWLNDSIGLSIYLADAAYYKDLINHAGSLSDVVYLSGANISVIINVVSYSLILQVFGYLTPYLMLFLINYFVDRLKINQLHKYVLVLYPPIITHVALPVKEVLGYIITLAFLVGLNRMGYSILMINRPVSTLMLILWKKLNHMNLGYVNIIAVTLLISFLGYQVELHTNILEDLGADGISLLFHKMQLKYLYILIAPFKLVIILFYELFNPNNYRLNYGLLMAVSSYFFLIYTVKILLSRRFNRSFMLFLLFVGLMPILSHRYLVPLFPLFVVTYAKRKRI